MVQHLQPDVGNASFYAGLLVSAYAFGEVFTAVIWGNISDRIGRKPVVLFGLVGVAISCVMFGLAKSFWVALVARLIGGMLNGNVAVMQTMLAEMVKNPEHERKSLSGLKAWGKTNVNSYCICHSSIRVACWRHSWFGHGWLPG